MFHRLQIQIASRERLEAGTAADDSSLEVGTARRRSISLEAGTARRFKLGAPMATYTPPPYFPQGSLAPPDRNRYRKFKLVMLGVALLLVLLLGGIAWAIWRLLAPAT